MHLIQIGEDGPWVDGDKVVAVMGWDGHYSVAPGSTEQPIDIKGLGFGFTQILCAAQTRILLMADPEQVARHLVDAAS